MNGFLQTKKWKEKKMSKYTGPTFERVFFLSVKKLGMKNFHAQ